MRTPRWTVSHRSVDEAVEPLGRVGAHRQKSYVIDHHQVCAQDPGDDFGDAAIGAVGAHEERRYKAIATITGANYGRMLREAESSVDAVIAKLEEIGSQRTAEARGDDWLFDSGLPSSLEQAAEWGITDVDILGATEYYKTDRGAKPNGTNLTLRSRMGVGYGWDAFHLAEELLTQPLLVIVGEIPGGFAAHRDGYEIVRRARSEKKELLVIKDWSHYDLYDKVEPVAQAMAKLTPFFTENL